MDYVCKDKVKQTNKSNSQNKKIRKDKNRSESLESTTAIMWHTEKEKPPPSQQVMDVIYKE